MRFCSLGSGSAGNATLVESDDGIHVTRILIDCGFGLREMESRLERATVDAASVDLVFVTHEHGDHIGSAVSFARRHGTPLAMSAGTWRAVGQPDVKWHVVRDGEPLAFKGLQLFPFTVPHDAREPLQLRVGDGATMLGVLTDTGCETPHVLANLQDCHALVLECNHDETLLTNGPYPPVLKNRVGGRLGHLSNAQAAGILSQCAHGRLQHVVAAHLSEQNNSPDLALAALAGALGANPSDLTVATQTQGADWRTLGSAR